MIGESSTKTLAYKLLYAIYWYKMKLMTNVPISICTYQWTSWISWRFLYLCWQWRLHALWQRSMEQSRDHEGEWHFYFFRLNSCYNYSGCNINDKSEPDCAFFITEGSQWWSQMLKEIPSWQHCRDYHTWGLAYLYCFNSILSKAIETHIL